MPVIDKSTWGPGPWQDEPDRVDFIHAGFSCFALRHPIHGFWCGYVGVPREHPLYGRHWLDTEGIAALEPYWTINYSRSCEGYICHVPKPGMPSDVWWFGFDCGHVFDLAPGSDARTRELFAAQGIKEWPRPFRADDPFREVYRDVAFVRAAIESLADQLAALDAAEV